MKKVCNKCKMELLLELFGNDKRNSDGRQGICNACKQQDKADRRDKRAFTNDYIVKSEKQCNKCSLTKSIDLFFKDKAMSDGHSSICKDCKKKNVYKWREQNKDRYNANQRSYQKANPEMRYGVEIKRRYGCTLEHYNQMLIQQEGKCQLCQRLHNPVEKKGRLFVDHCHKTGKVRGLLCRDCNSALGYFQDDTRVMAEAIAYIIRHRDGS